MIKYLLYDKGNMFVERQEAYINGSVQMFELMISKFLLIMLLTDFVKEYCYMIYADMLKLTNFNNPKATNNSNGNNSTKLENIFLFSDALDKTI